MSILLTKISIFFFFISLFYLIRIVYILYVSYKTETPLTKLINYNQEKYLILIAISFIFTQIMTGL